MDLKKIIKILVLLFATNVFSQNLSNIPGVFLDIGYGARPMGVGGAFTAMANDINALVWNPAGLANLQGRQITFFYTKQFNLIPYTMAAYANNFGKTNWTHSEGLFVSGDDALRETMLYVGFGYKADRLIKKLKLGVTLKYKNATYGNNKNGGIGQVTGNALGVGLDFGAIYPVREKILAALVLKNVYDTVYWNSSSMDAYNQGSPLRLSFGLALQNFPNTTIGFDLEKALHADIKDRLNIGIERSFFHLVSIRAGAFQTLQPTANMNYSVGLGFQYQRNSVRSFFDLAYMIQELENSIRISFTLGY
ncbi:MAG: UPF0164 family protein [Calditrichaeota bacterium]|nr:UPF0164 family protein [Calditrichota bacterium]